MPTRIDAGDRGPGIKTGRASDLTDIRQGTYDKASSNPKANTSRTTAHERAQWGGAVQGEPIPDRSEEAALPEGLKREPKGPYSRTKGRGPSAAED